MLGVLPLPPVPEVGSLTPPPPEPPEPTGLLGPSPCPAPPPADVIVVNPEPDIEELLPLLPEFALPANAPPSPTVTVITVAGNTV